MFHNCKTKEEAKKLFRKLALRLHPDHGGTTELYMLLKEAHDNAFKSRQTNNASSIPKYSQNSYNHAADAFNYYADRLRYVHASNSGLQQLLTAIVTYAERNRSFDMEYIKRILQELRCNGKIKIDDYERLENIYRVYQMQL